MKGWLLERDVSEMNLVLNLARQHATADSAPIAARIIDPFGVHNLCFVNHLSRHENVLGHAELLCLSEIQRTSVGVDFSQLTMYVTLEPCPMCAWALRSVGIGRVVFGAYNSKYGAAGSVYDFLRSGATGYSSTEVVGGVLERECGELLTHFFEGVR